MHEKIRKATISAATTVGPTGVEARIETRIPVSEQTTEIMLAQIITPLKLLNSLIAERAGNTISAEIKRDPTRFMARTIITAVITAINRL